MQVADVGLGDVVIARSAEAGRAADDHRRSGGVSAETSPQIRTEQRADTPIAPDVAHAGGSPPRVTLIERQRDLSESAAVIFRADSGAARPYLLLDAAVEPPLASAIADPSYRPRASAAVTRPGRSLSNDRAPVMRAVES